MRIVKVELATDFGNPTFDVVYTMRGRGNKQFATTVHAIDELGAYNKVKKQILESEEKAWIANVEEMELLVSKFPKAKWRPRLNYAKRILREIRKDMGKEI